MRYLFFPLLLLTALIFACDDNGGTTTDESARRGPTVIYLSRHAEKDSGNDPNLLASGQQRADRIAALLGGKNISAVYATGYKRTQQTAAPTARAAGVRVRNYSASKSASRLTERWVKRHRGETIYVVGHSNTVPGLVNALIGEQRYGEISHDEFGNLFKVTVEPGGAARVEELTSN